MEKKNAEFDKIRLNDLKQSLTFSIDVIAIKFGSLVDKISELSTLDQEFGPQNEINNENFKEFIKNLYFEMLVLKNQ